MIVTTPLVYTAQPPATVSIGALAWIHGTWVSVDWRETVEEHWTSRAGIAQPNSQPPSEFTSTRVDQEPVWLPRSRKIGGWRSSCDQPLG